MTTQAFAFLSAEQVEHYHTQGYLIVPGTFDATEIEHVRDHFDLLARDGKAIPGYWTPDLTADPVAKPLARYPRVMHPHRYNEFCRRMMLHPRIEMILRDLMGEEPVACQSMYYFKPPGAKGQALHQDNYYLRVKPCTCVAGWVAIDPSTPENGGLVVVPGTQNQEIICPSVADDSESFTTHLVNAPKGMKAIHTRLHPGDGLFFNGSLIHGSGPNRSASQWRRSFICHYMPRSSQAVAKFYAPIFDFKGNAVEYDHDTSGGPCGDISISSYDRAG